MKNIWKVEDITAGLFIIKESSTKKAKDLSFARTVTFKIGWENEKGSPYGLINIMTDGWYYRIGDKKALVDHLNKDEYGYRPLTKKEMFEMLESSDQGFY